MEVQLAAALATIATTPPSDLRPAIAKLAPLVGRFPPASRAAHAATVAAALTSALAVTPAELPPATASELAAGADQLLRRFQVAPEDAAWAALGAAVEAPLRRTLGVVAAYVRALAASPAPAPGARTIRLFGYGRDTATVVQVRRAHPDAEAARAALDGLLYAAAMAWARKPAQLRANQQDRGLIDDLGVLGFRLNDAVDCLRTLLSIPFDQRAVVFVPELEEAYGFVLIGVACVGELYLRLHAALPALWPRLGIESETDSDGHDDGDQGHGLRCRTIAFQIYPWQAVDPATQRPASRRYVWTAMGGRGDHSLPADYLVGDLTTLDGHAVLALVGPNAPGGSTSNFSRHVHAAPPFAQVVGRLADMRRLEPSEYARWHATLLAAAGAVVPEAYPEEELASIRVVSGDSDD